MPDALVSVVMNCYNGEKFLAEAIDSVIAQSYERWEIIFWDNQSTDRSAEVVRAYGDPRIKYFYAPTHTWLYEARNSAIAEARGDFIAFLDVDDQWLPDKLQRQIPLFGDPEVGFVCGDTWIAHEARNKRWRAFNRPVPTGRVLNALLKNYFVPMPTLVVRRAALESLAYPCDPRLHIIGDFDLVIRLSIHWKMACVQDPVAVYRIHGSNETGKHRARLFQELETWWQCMRQVPEIARAPNARYMASQGAYLRAMHEAARGEKQAALRGLRSLPWGRRKLKLALAILAPVAVLRAIRN